MNIPCFLSTGIGVYLRTGAALLRFDGSRNTKVHGLAPGVVVAVIDVVLGGVRDILECHLICGGTLVHADDAGRCQLVRAADVVVRGVRFSFRRS